MGILDSIVEWIATQVMNLLDLITGSVLGALGCDMSTFLRYFPAAETLYEIFVAIGVGFILLNLVWQLFRNFGLGLGLSAEDPVKLAIKSILFIFLALFADQIMTNKQIRPCVIQRRICFFAINPCVHTAIAG